MVSVLPSIPTLGAKYHGKRCISVVQRSVLVAWRLTNHLREQVFGKNQADITDAERTRAKVVCLGIIYGMLRLLVRFWSE